MGNIIDYVRNELRTFEVAPFNDVDSLVLSQFAYLDLSDQVGDPFEDLPSVRLGDLYRAECFSMFINGTFEPDLNLRLLEALCASPRFRNIRVNYHISELDTEAQMQFSATSFILNDESVILHFEVRTGRLSDGKRISIWRLRILFLRKRQHCYISTRFRDFYRARVLCLSVGIRRAAIWQYMRR